MTYYNQYMVYPFQICDAIMGLHAFTGSDYTPSFKDKGKVNPFKAMRSNQSYIQAFKDLGSAEVIHADTLKSLEKYVCQVYGDKTCDKVNELRHKKLISKERKKNKSSGSSDQPAEKLVDLYKKMKRSNPAALPPCHASFKQQVFRSNLVTNMWKQAPNARMTLWDKSKHGYKEINGKCAVHWFDGPEVPDIAYSEPQDYEEEDPSTELDSSDESESESDSDNSDSDMD